MLVGNGMAGMRAVEELLALAPDLYDITVFGAEPHGNYNRILLSPVLAAEKTIADIMLNPREWYAEHGIRCTRAIRSCGSTARGGASSRRAASRRRYDRLILATGSNPVVLPLPGKELPGVVAYRDIADVDRMIAAAHEPPARGRDRRRPARPRSRVWACRSAACTSPSCICSRR